MDSQSLYTLVEAELSRTRFVLEKFGTESKDFPQTGKILEALKSHSNRLEELIRVQGEASLTRNLFRVPIGGGQKEKCEHHLRMCKELNDALMSFVVARMGEDIHDLTSKSTMIDAGLQEQIAQGTWLQARCNHVIDTLERHDLETRQMHTRKMQVTLRENSEDTRESSEQEDYDESDESDESDGDSSLMVLGHYNSDLPKIRNFHHLCLRGLEILAQISSLKEFETYFTRLETWSFGLMGRTDGRSDEMSLDGIFGPGDGSRWPFWTSDVHSVTAGYSMIVDRFLKILLYIESLLITIEPNSSDAISYLNLLQDFFEAPIIRNRLQEISMQQLDEAKTFQSKAMICVGGIEDQVRRLYDILPAISSTRQIYCFRETLRHVTISSSRGMVRRKAKRSENKSQSQELIEFNAQLSEAITASLRGKKEEDIRKEAELFEKVNDQLRTWKETRKGELTAQMIKTLKDMQEPLRNLHHDLKIDSEDPTSSTKQKLFISPKLVSETRRTFQGHIEELLEQGRYQTG
ncbi:hypothetical protein F5Y09DRAFT_305544 [Xylaria sp. FL1042]|nr:hypothetical protein F5Y09DRAFT_305544 [Xylaria sp. FL1042]